MFLTRSEYDRGVSTFSPEGRLFQVEYSLEAIKLGSTAIGISTSEGVILGVEKRVTSSLLESSSIEKIVEIDHHIGCAMSGLTADARSMIDHARVSSLTHNLYYDEDIGVESLTQSVCDLALRFGEGAGGEKRLMSRPFGVALLIAGVDKELDTKVVNAINNALTKINAMAAPFVNNIKDPSAGEAIKACQDLDAILSDVKTALRNN